MNIFTYLIIILIIIIIIVLFKLKLYINDISRYTNKKVVYCFWVGDKEITKNRKENLDTIRKNIGVDVILVKEKDLYKYTKITKHPLHKSYKYLSATQKSDYLRCYFLHHFGGGYTDIKRQTQNWSPFFDKLYNSDMYALGYKKREGQVVSWKKEVVDSWRELIGPASNIFKCNTPFTNEWYNNMNIMLDTKYEELKQNPAKFSQDTLDIMYEGKKSKYPMVWSEFNFIFYDTCYKYKHKLFQDIIIDWGHWGLTAKYR